MTESDDLSVTLNNNKYTYTSYKIKFCIIFSRTLDYYIIIISYSGRFIYFPIATRYIPLSTKEIYILYRGTFSNDENEYDLIKGLVFGDNDVGVGEGEGMVVVICY